jgi:hypothetical protein
MALDISAPGGTLSVECHISRSLINRRLGGEELAEEIQSDLELHLKVCSACQKFVDEKRLELADRIRNRASLAGSAADPVEALNLPSEKLGALYGKPKSPAGHRARTVIFSTLLAAVLFGMSSIAKDPGMIFGPKAAAKDAKPEPAPAKSEGKEGEGDKAAHGPESGEAEKGHDDSGHEADGHSADSHEAADPADHAAAFGAASHSADEHSTDGHTKKEAPAEPKAQGAAESRSLPEPPADEDAGLLIAEGGSVKAAAPDAKPKAEAPKPAPAKPMAESHDSHASGHAPSPRPAPAKAAARAPARRKPAASRRPLAPPAAKRPAARPRPSSPAKPGGFTVYDETGKKL